MKHINVGLKSEIFGYLGIIDSELFPVHRLAPKFSKVFVLLENPEFRDFLIVLYIR